MSLTKIVTHLQWRKISQWLLGAFWVFGLTLGALTAHGCDGIIQPLIRESAGLTPSLIGLCCATFFPFLLSAFAVSLSEPWLLLVISTCKAFSFSFCAVGVSLAFGQSGWLVRFLFLFSDLLQLPLLCWYWLRHIKGSANGRWDIPFCTVSLTAIGVLDYAVIAPFLASVIR